MLLFAALIGLLVSTSLAAVASMPTAGTAPARFSNTVVAQLATPTGMAWTPDGRMLVTQDSRQLRVVRDGRLLATPAFDLTDRICRKVSVGC